MTRPTLAVLKVGGSLFDWPELPLRLAAYLGSRRALDPFERPVLIAGGGPAVDWKTQGFRRISLGFERYERVELAGEASSSF